MVLADAFLRQSRRDRNEQCHARRQDTTDGAVLQAEQKHRQPEWVRLNVRYLEFGKQPRDRRDGSDQDCELDEAAQGRQNRDARLALARHQISEYVALVVQSGPRACLVRRRTRLVAS
jgi:hypothetical protein